MKNKTIAVWFSCGAASAVAAYRAIKKYGDNNTIRIMNNPVQEEDLDNRRFLKDVEKWLGVEIEVVRHPKWPNASAVEVWEKRKYMSGIHGAPCTSVLKKEARQHWESKNEWDYLVLGFTAEERGRHERFALTERENLLPVLIDDGLTKAECYQILLDQGIQPPEMYKRGYPNANCIGCVKATGAAYWNLVRKDSPKVFKERAEQSRKLGAKLVRIKGERIFLDELDPSIEGKVGDSVDCSSFCEEWQTPLFLGNGVERDIKTGAIV